MIEDICKIGEVSSIIHRAHSCTKCLRSHRCVSSLFKQVIGVNGVRLVLFPLTRFCYVHLMLSRYLKNKSKLEELIQNYQWVTATEGISSVKVDAFENNILSAPWVSINCLNELLRQISAVIHHVDSTSSKAS